MSDLVLSLVSTSTSQHPRFLIADPQSKFWTGSDWTEHESDGCLFANVNDAGRAIQELLLAEYGQKSMRRFVAHHDYPGVVPDAHASAGSWP